MPPTKRLRKPEKQLTPPERNASVEEHKKHAEEVLQLEYHKQRPAAFRGNDEAKP